MLIITEKNIEDRKSSIKATLNYYLRQMDLNKVDEADKNFFTEGCQSLLESLDNIKNAMIMIHSSKPEEHIKQIRTIKKQTELIFLESKVHLNDLMQAARMTIRSYRM